MLPAAAKGVFSKLSERVRRVHDGRRPASRAKS